MPDCLRKGLEIRPSYLSLDVVSFSGVDFALPFLSFFSSNLDSVSLNESGAGSFLSCLFAIHSWTVYSLVLELWYLGKGCSSVSILYSCLKSNPELVVLKVYRNRLDTIRCVW